MEKILAQICFAKDADLVKVREQLEQLKAEDTYEFRSCFLPPHVVKEKGWSTEIGDLIEDVLGYDHVYALGHCKNFEEAMEKLPEARKYVAETVNRMFVLDSGTAEGVRKEIEFFTNTKVILMP